MLSCANCKYEAGGIETGEFPVKIIEQRQPSSADESRPATGPHGLAYGLGPEQGQPAHEYHTLPNAHPNRLGPQADACTALDVDSA